MQWCKHPDRHPDGHGNSMTESAHESMSIPWVHIYTIRPCQKHAEKNRKENNYINTIFRNTEIQIRDILKYKLYNYPCTKLQNTEIQIWEKKKNRNTNTQNTNT